MFEIFCPTRNSRVLLGERRIERFRNITDGPSIGWRCYCGYCGTRGSLHLGHGRGRRGHVAA